MSEKYKYIGLKKKILYTIEDILVKRAPIEINEFEREFKLRTMLDYMFDEHTKLLESLEFGRWDVKIDEGYDFIFADWGKIRLTVKSLWLFDAENKRHYIVDIYVENMEIIEEGRQE